MMTNLSDTDMPFKHSNITVCAYIAKAFFKDQSFTVQQLEEKVLKYNLWKRINEQEEEPIIIRSDCKVITFTLRSLLWALKTKNLLAESQGRGLYRLNCQEIGTFLEQYPQFPRMETWLGSMEAFHEAPRSAATTLLDLRRRSIHHAGTKQQNDEHTSNSTCHLTKLIHYRQTCRDIDVQIPVLERRRTDLKRDLMRLLEDDGCNEDLERGANGALNAMLDTRMTIRQLKSRRASLATHTRQTIETITDICKKAEEQIEMTI